MDLVDLIVEKREAIIATCHKYGATNVRVFGSCARDDYNENSDVDFLVRFTAPYDYGDLFMLQEELEKLLGHKVDVGTDEMLRDHIREHVLAEAVAL
jgi:uncharacterized protein